MNSNEKLIHTFYNAFQNKDYKTMQKCYTGNANFIDPIFVNLNSRQVKAMWEMFCVKSKDLSIEYKNIKADEIKGSGEWIATYTFSKNEKKVINHIHSNFTFLNGKIVLHRDTFNFYKWIRQTMGLTGLLFGWTSFVKNKIKQRGLKNLTDFMSKSNNY